MIQYPGWREMLAAGAGFDVLVDAAVSQIHAECGEDDFYLLAGYSFGGFITWETARRLVEYGHRVGFLGTDRYSACDPATGAAEPAL